MYGPEIENVIFDLGGVILDLEVSKTMDAFGKLAGVPASVIRESVTKSPFFNDYEKGLLTDAEFRNRIRELLKKEVTDWQIDKAWNAMLGALPRARLTLLEELGKKHGLYLLSNTNNIHLQFFNEIVRSVSWHARLEPFSINDYYSHLLKMRKPDAAIFEHVLRQNELNPSRTLFLDDNPDNLAGAQKAGIKTIHITSTDQLFSIFS